MNIQTSNDNVPPAVYRYLLPDENNIIAVRKHPAVLAGPGLLLAGSAIAAGLLTATRRKDAAAVRGSWAASGIMLAATAIRAAAWRNTYCVVTTSRLVSVKGLAGVRVASVPMREIRDVEFRRSWRGRLLGYGTFVIESPGAGKKIRFVPYPEQIYLEICGILAHPDDKDD